MNYLVLAIGILLITMVLLWLIGLLRNEWRRAQFHETTRIATQQLFDQKIAVAKREFERNGAGWNGYRKFEVLFKKREAKDLYSFYLSPHDGKALPNYRPGQFLTFRLDIHGKKKPVVRCYSISDSYNQDGFYRVTVKKIMPSADPTIKSAGLVSGYLHEQLEEGDIIDVQSPQGNFVLDPYISRPAVLIGAGVGITPLLSMAKSIIAADTKRRFYLFYGVRNSEEHAFKEELEALEDYPHCSLIICYSDPSKKDLKVEGQEFQHRGRIEIELIKKYLNVTNMEFFVCGPQGMMSSLSAELQKWGVAESQIKTEAFGPAAIKKKIKQQNKSGNQQPDPPCTVTFSKSGVAANWNPENDNLLELAEDHGVELPSGCRTGNCGSCNIAIKSGKVFYSVAPGITPEDKSCLTCIAKPQSDLILDG